MSSIPMEKAVELALAEHRAGNFKRAEAFYLEILRQDPGNVDAMHLLGVLAHQGHNPAAAVQLISAAIRKRADVAVFHYNLAEALAALGQTDEAIASYKTAIELAPDYFEAHNNLGNALNARRRFAEGETACRRAIEIQPDNPAPWNNLGNSLRGLDRQDESLASYEKAVALQPNFPEAINNMAMALCALNRTAEGIEKFRQVIRLRPTLADAHNNLGVALVHLGRIEEAGECFQTAADLKPDHADAHNNLGAALRTLGKSIEAIPIFEKALAIAPNFAPARSNLAASLKDVGRYDESLAAIEQVIRDHPTAAKELFLRATILRDLRRFDEAIDAYRDVLKVDPDNAGSLTALGYALLERGDLDEAKRDLDRSLQLKPDPQTHSNVLMAINYHPAYSPADLLAAHKTWADLHERPHVASWKAHTNDPNPDRRLRIGYVSPDFRGHSVSFFVEPILEHHDHAGFEIFAYAHLAYADMNTWKLRSKIDQWREISLIDPGKVAQQVREDQIDILVELAGHTANNALTVFARKPAPVQVNMIGFPSTTGLCAIDYRITDELCDPSGVSDPFNTEKLVRLPKLFWCYRPPDGAPSVGPLPADANGFVTFTSVNNFTKVTPAVQRTWARIIAAVPNARLIMQTTALASAHTQDLVRARFAELGVSSDRLEFRPTTSILPYLQLLTGSDMTLDPWPFNGGTTTCHSLWMGAPVISMAGATHAARMGLSILTSIGLPELCARTEDEYVDIAVKLANDLPRLRRIRATVRDRLLASPLLDGAGYTRDLESAYRAMWRTWCAAGS